MRCKLLKNIYFLYLDLRHLTATNLRSDIFHHLSISPVSYILLRFCFDGFFFALSESWELVFLHRITYKKARRFQTRFVSYDYGHIIMVSYIGNALDKTLAANIILDTLSL